MDVSLPTSKAVVRRSVLAARRAGSTADSDAQLRSALAALVSPDDVVAAYCPLADEPGGPELPAALAEVAGRVLLPVLLSDGDLDWGVYDGPASMFTARFGVLEPSGLWLGAGAVATASIVIVPAIAVGHSGVRLGRGGGSYDRALARVTSSFVVAPLYDGELMPTVPAEPHDQRVNAVVMPSAGLIRLPMG